MVAALLLLLTTLTLKKNSVNLLLAVVYGVHGQAAQTAGQIFTVPATRWRQQQQLQWRGEYTKRLPSPCSILTSKASTSSFYVRWLPNESLLAAMLAHKMAQSSFPSSALVARVAHVDAAMASSSGVT